MGALGANNEPIAERDQASVLLQNLPDAYVLLWLRLLKKSAFRWRKNLSDLILQGTNGTRGHLNGPMRPQDGVSGTFADPFVSMMRYTAQ